MNESITDLLTHSTCNDDPNDSLMMRAIRKEPVPVTPVWLMRQAGRYMAEYRCVREKTDFLQLCKNPQLCAEVMATAVEVLGVDAAIIFSDLLPILEPLGFELEFTKGDGPVIHNPLVDESDLKRVKPLESLDSLDYVMETVTRTRQLIDKSKPVIGFAGAPFTLASYAIEGGGSRSFSRTKKVMFGNRPLWERFIEILTDAIAKYLIGQFQAGAQIVQIFDSWVGCLGVSEYERFVLPATKRLIEQVAPYGPVIYFGTGNPALLPLFAQTGPQVIGVDWRIDLDEAWKLVGPDFALQGNLDPVILLTNEKTIREEVVRIKKQVAGRSGFVFNLGHGILKETPVENVITLVRAVHE